MSLTELSRNLPGVASKLPVEFPCPMLGHVVTAGPDFASVTLDEYGDGQLRFDGALYQPPAPGAIPTDGQRVVVVFLGGRRANPVIVAFPGWAG